MSYQLELLDLPFSGDDLEWKVQTCGANNGKAWALIVPYVANRAIMSRLDQAVGKLNWKNQFKDLGNGAVECGIAIRMPDSDEWVWKWDVGEEVDVPNNGDTSIRIKSGRSNSMKRAAVQWGMGRHLYHIGETWAECTMQRPQGKEWTRAKTKDRQEFWWRVPAALSAPAPQPAPAPVPPKPRDCARLFALCGDKIPKEQLDALKPLLGCESWKFTSDGQYNLAIALVELAIAHGWETMFSLVTAYKEKNGSLERLSPDQVRRKIQELNDV